MPADFLTRKDYDEMKHHGNVTKINGAEVEPVDVITFGSPCQDLSVAGKRAGIQDGERSNLFFEAVRIIKEMREATNGEYPKYAVWENVPGAFSSNKGHDFHAVLEALCSVCDDAVSIPEPCDPKRPDKLLWSGAGEIVGSNYSLAWRTLDAQYWGVPQRRKRIYLVADFTGGCAGEILFKPDSLRGDLSQGDEAWQGSTVDAVGSVDGSVGVECLNPWDAQSIRQYSASGTYPTLSNNATGGQNRQGVVFAAGFCQGASPAAKTIGYQEEVSPTIKGAPSGTAQVPAVCYPLNEQIVLRHGALGKNTGFGAGEDGDPAYTLQANHPHAVCYDSRGNGDGETVAVFEPKSALEENWGEATAKNALRAGASKSSHAVVQKTACFQNTGRGWWNESETAATVRTACGGDSVKANLVAEKKRRYIIRRLTPTECARLQGFPDDWGHLAPYNPADADFWEEVRKTHAEINGKKYKPVKNLKKWYDKLHTGSAEYKAYGNGLALPCAENVMRGIAEAMRNEKGQFVSEGGIIEHKGYTCIYKPDHPRARANGYVREHILVAEEMLGRPLGENEVVHHINGDKSDNRPENLMVFPNQNEHVKCHNRTDGTKYKYRDGEYTIAELAEFSAVDYATLTQRINKLKWDIGKAVETPKRGQPTLGSLFDGIGGFPLAGVLNGITPVWCSEIEPYPIAVTVSRFGGAESI